MAEPARGSASPPIFDKIAIVGLGLIGGSIALAARQLWPSSLVIGVDDKDVLEHAMVLHAIDVAADDLVVAAEADLVILAAPVEQNLARLRELDDSVHTPAIVTDVSSTKRRVVEAAADLPPRFTFIGGHPLAGAARSGIAYARPDLFQTRPWIFTPPATLTGDALARLYSFVSALGAVPMTMEAEEHDRVLAYLSHLPQLVASSLMRLVGDRLGETGLALAGRGLADTTRLASSPAHVWVDICTTNRDFVTAALDEMIATLREVREGITGPAKAERHAGGVLEETFDRANRWREVLEERTRG